MTRVAVVGLGAMGSRIAQRLLLKGHEVTVWNRSIDRIETLLRLGARAAPTPREAAAACEVVITMVADPRALQAVSEGPNGIGGVAGPGLRIIEMSTVGPDANRRLASVLPDGASLVDAPVLGSIAEAEAGTLTIFAGGFDADLDAAEPLLSQLGTVLRLGPPGAGAAAKLVANAALFGTLAVLGETLSLAQVLGLGPEQAAAVLRSTPLGEQAAKRLPSIAAGAYPSRFRLSLARKDAELIRGVSEAAGARVPALESAAGWLAEAEASGRGDQDYTAMLATVLGGSGTRESGVPVAAEKGAEIGTYDGLIVDLDGVVWLGGAPIEGVAQAIAQLRSGGVRIVFLTNDPQQSAGRQAQRLTAIGIPTSADEVVTACSATAVLLGAREDLRGARTLVIGADALRGELADAGFVILSREEARDAAVVVVGGHERFDHRDLRAAMRAIEAGASLFATGRDPFVPGPSGPEPGTGAIVAAIETATGATAVITGKPDPRMFAIARGRLGDCKNVAVVGDNLATDIVGARRAGLQSILVLSGATHPRELAASTIKPDLVLPSLAAFGMPAPLSMDVN